MHTHSAGITAYNLSKQLSNNPLDSFYPKSLLLKNIIIINNNNITITIIMLKTGE